MMVSIMTWTLYVTLTFALVTMVIIILTTVDNNAFDFKCNFGIRSAFKKKTQRFSNFGK